MPEDFKFSDDKQDKGVEASLDDFFQPPGPETAEKKTAKDKKAAAPLGKLKEEPEVNVFGEEGAQAGAKKEAETKDKGKKKTMGFSIPGSAKTGIIIGLVVLAVAALGAAGYYAYTKIFMKAREVTIGVPRKPPAPQAQPDQAAEAAKPEQPAAQPMPGQAAKPAAGPAAGATAPAKPTAEKPPVALAPGAASQPGPGAAKPGASSPPEKVAVKPVAEQGKPSPAAPAPGAGKQPVAASASKPVMPTANYANLPIGAPGKGWSCQVGAYMLRESIDDPLQEVRSLGYKSLYLVDKDQSLMVYHLYLRGQFDLAAANAKKASLEQIGFKPRLEPLGTQYRVKAYSYGSNAVAAKSKNKIEQAKLGPAEIIPKREKVTLHQLRVGPYVTKSDALSVLQNLRAKGLSPVLVQEK